MESAASKLQAITRTGYLTKHGGGQGCLSRKSWKRRLFALQGNKLAYMVGPDMPVLGAIFITPDTGLEIANYKDSKRMLVIITASRTFHCISDSSDDARQWLAVLKQVRGMSGELVSATPAAISPPSTAVSSPGSTTSPAASSSPRKRINVNAQLQLELRVTRTPEEPMGLSIATADDADTTFHVVREVAPGSPAALAGVEKHDLLLKVNATELSGLSHDRAAAIIKSESGTVSFLVARKPPKTKKTPSASPDKSASSSVSASVHTASPAPPAEGSKAASLSSALFEAPATADNSTPASPAPQTGTEENAEERAERLRKMKEARMERKSSKQMEILEVLSIIDNLKED